MIFSSITFLFYFLPALILVYWVCPARFRNYVLLLFSTVFYAWGAPKFVFVILGSTYLDFHIVKQLARSKSERRRKQLLFVSIILNLGLLAWFKYANFFVENVQVLLNSLGSNHTFNWVEIALPIGISFYTFQTLTYSIDVYRNTHAPLKRVQDYMLYIIMFPQLIAGPIVRFHEIADQLTNRLFTRQNILEGFSRFTIGLAKKVLIANVLAEHIDDVFRSDVATLDSGMAWIAILGYTFQIYFDFSGYSDMAIGLGKIFGFRFPENFNAPYISHSITEFWRRWHITLGAFMRNYLYIPLGGNQSGSYKTYRNLGLVFLLSGLWHGASWNFVLWGVWHGFFLILERFTSLSRSQKFRAIRIPLTFLIVVLGWVLFRIEDLEKAIAFYKRLFAFEGDFPILWYHSKFRFTLILAFLLSWSALTRSGKFFMHWLYPEHYSINQRILISLICVVLFVYSVSALSASSFNPFIYYRF